MKRIFLVFTLAIFVITISNAQVSPIAKGQKQLNFGTGLSSWGLPLFLGVDYGVHPDITIGGEISYRGYHDKWNSHKYHHTIYGISGNGNYHFNRIMDIPSNWDFYAGINLGFFIWSSESGYGGSGTSGLGLGAQIGGRYYWSDKWGINLEFGGGNAFGGGKVGLSMKF
ncbi:MAG: hypothetical protein R2757_01440 [Draconibacterium sp.]